MDPQEPGASREAAPADTRSKDRFAGYYRRSPLGAPLIASAIGVPLVLALIGGATAGPKTQVTPAPVTPTPVAAPTSVAPAAPKPVPTVSGKANVLSVTQTGKAITVSGAVADKATKTNVVAALKKAYGANATVTDQLSVVPGTQTMDAGALAGLGTALKGISGLTLTASPGQVGISGVAATEDAKGAATNALKSTFPGATVDDTRVLVGDPTKAPASCAELPAYIKLVTTQTEIQFTSSGTTLTPAATTALERIAAQAKKCEGTKLTVAGYSDSQGDETANKALSLKRAEAAKAALVKDGLAADALTTTGEGPANPVASNDTADGRAKNRRVDITVA